MRSVTLRDSRHARGGCPAVEDQHILASNAFGTALLMANIAALELSDWSLTALRRALRPLAQGPGAGGEAVRHAHQQRRAESV